MMDAYLNFHTHRRSASVAEQVVVNRMPFQGEWDSDDLFSVGIHPWYILDNLERSLAEVDRLANESRCVAIGEIGLDKCVSTDWRLQEEVFRRQLALAGSKGLPVVIHCVRAWSELLHILKTEKITVPCIIHGFRGKPDLARQLLDCGLYLSFGFRYNSGSLTMCPSDRIFFETDEDERPVEQLYCEAAELRAVSPEILRNVCWENMQTVCSRKGNRLV